MVAATPRQKEARWVDRKGRPPGLRGGLCSTCTRKASEGESQGAAPEQRQVGTGKGQSGCGCSEGNSGATGGTKRGSTVHEQARGAGPGRAGPCKQCKDFGLYPKSPGDQ